MASELGFVDLVDFFKRWPEERQRMLSLEDGQNLDEDTLKVLHAMIFILDRVGPSDLSS